MHHLKFEDYFSDAFLMRFFSSPIRCPPQGMKEYNVDLVMMNGGDIRGRDGLELGAPQLSHKKKRAPFWLGFLGICWG